MKNKYPECEKLSKISEESQKLGEFLEWLYQKYTLCEWSESKREEFTDDKGEIDYQYSPEGYYPSRVPIQTLLAEYFDIDMEKVDKERFEILKSLG